MTGTLIYSKLSTDNAIKEAIGDNVYPVVIPQEVKSNCIVYYLTGNDPDDTKSGASTLDTYTFDVVCIGKKYNEVDQLSALVRNALESQLPANESIKYKTESDDFEPETQRFMRILTFKMRYKR